MNDKNSQERVVCIEQGEYPASLTVGKTYATMSDAESEKRGLVRVIDDSSEDYLYPESYFLPVEPMEGRR